MPHPTRTTACDSQGRVETPDLPLLQSLIDRIETCGPSAAREVLAKAGARFARDGDTIRITCAGIDGTGEGVNAAVSDWRRRAAIRIAMALLAAREATAMRTATGDDRIAAAWNVLRHSQDQRDPRPRLSWSWLPGPPRPRHSSRRPGRTGHNSANVNHDAAHRGAPADARHAAASISFRQRRPARPGPPGGSLRERHPFGARQ